MYLKSNGEIKKSEMTKSIFNSNYKIYWEGLVFFPTLEEGISSIKHLLKSIHIDDSPEQIVKKTAALRGSWSIFIENLGEKYWLIISDHSHQSNVYFNKFAASTSFLKLRDQELDKSDVSLEALFMLLLSGVCYSDEIVYAGIKKLDYRSFLILKNGEKKICKKELEDSLSLCLLGKNFNLTMDSYFKSLTGYKICLDLTGGTDTRALLIILSHYGYRFDVAINGDDYFPEAVIADQVAIKADKKLKKYTIDESEVDYNVLRSSWKACDGLSMSIGSYLFERWRKRLGYSLVISGRGANILKDDAFLKYAAIGALLQKDFKSVIATLINKGIMFWWSRPLNDLINILSNEYREAFAEVIKHKILSLSNLYESYPVKEAVNKIFYDYTLNHPVGTINEFMPRFCPFFEPDIVNFASRIPLIKRFNGYFYRENVSNLKPELSVLPTYPFGKKLSGSPIHIITDYLWLLRQAITKIFYPKKNNKNHENNNLKKIERYIRLHPDLADALESLKESGIIQRTIGVEHLDFSIASNILQIYYLTGH